MTKTILISIGLWCCALVSHAGQPCETGSRLSPYKINGEVNGLKTGTPVYLLYRPNKFRTDTLGVAAVKQGKFEFTLTPATFERAGQQLVKMGTYEGFGEMELKGMLCYMAIDSGRQELPLFLDDGGISVKAASRTWPDARMSGSDMNADFLAFKKQLINTYPYFNTLFFPEPEKVYAQLVENASNAYKMEGNSERFQGWVDQYVVYTEALVEFVRHHPDATFSSFLLSGAGLYNVQRVYADHHFNALYSSLTGKAKDSFYGKQLAYKKTEIESRSSYGFIGIGDAAPEINQVDLGGKSFSLKKLLSNGSKCVLVDFWASSCAVCRKAMPFYKQLLNEFGDQGFSIVAYSHDTDEKIWKNAIAKDGTEAFYHSGAVHDKEKKVAKDYKSPVAYCIFVLDKDGMIIGEKLNHIDLFLGISELLL